jgi:glutathione synthase/RimK-type ligase-like ATP-grasp enzyme
VWKFAVDAAVIDVAWRAAGRLAADLYGIDLLAAQIDYIHLAED